MTTQLYFSRAVLGIFLTCDLTGCQPTATSQVAVPMGTTSPDPNFSEIKTRIDALQDQFNALNPRLVKLEVYRETQEAAYHTGVFDPTETSFQRVDAPSGFGSFAISVKDVRAFGDGVRIQINFGNPTMAAFQGVTLKMRYGGRPPDMSEVGWAEKYNVWNGALKTKELTLTDELHPGGWNPVNVTLPGIEASHFGYFELSLNTNTISLRQ